MNKVFGLAILGLNVVLHEAHAVDFVIKTKSAAIANGEAQVIYTLKNLDIEEFSGSVRIKPFLLPAHSNGTGRASLQGVALAGKNFEVTLPPNVEVSLQYSAKLPFVKPSDYLLGAIVNSNVLVPEKERDNNLTEDLVSVGHVAHLENPPSGLENDLYMDLRFMRPRYGFAGHEWRLFQRGKVNPIEPLWAYFMVADLVSKKVFASDYEKTVRWVSGGSDRDEQGRVIPFDRYSNPPSYSKLPSGEYHVVAWINSRETISEPDDSNNIALERFSVSRFRAQVPQSTMIALGPSDHGVITRTVKVVSDYFYRTPITWQIDPSSIPPGVSISPLSGEFAQNATQFDLVFAVTADEIGFGTLGLALKVNIGGQYLETLYVPAYIQKFRFSPVQASVVSWSRVIEVEKHKIDWNGYVELRNPNLEPIMVFLASETPSMSVMGSSLLTLSGGTTQRVPIGYDCRVEKLGTTVRPMKIWTSGLSEPTVLEITLVCK